MIKGALIILILTLIAAVGTHLFHPRAPIWYEVLEPLGPSEVTMTEVEKRWHGEVFWIDARSDESFAQEHIPGAININEQHRDAQLIDHLDKLQDNQKPIVVYCDGHACQASKKMRDYLLEQTPFSRDVWVLKGGWPAWKKSKSGK